MKVPVMIEVFRQASLGRFSMDDELREMVMERVNAPRITAAAIKNDHLHTLKQDGYAKTRAGLTSITEVMRALAV